MTALGSTVAWAGDITQDDFDEILIGAPNHGGGKGRVYLIDGGAIKTAIDGGVTSLDLSLVGSASYGASISGISTDDKLGWVMPAVGNLDGGRPDFVLASDSAASGYGGVYVFYGDNITSGSGTNITIDFGVPNNVTVSAAQRTLSGSSYGESFGAAVALLPDLLLDDSPTDESQPLPELAIGAPYANGTNGAVYIVNSAAINGSGFNTIWVPSTGNAAVTLVGVGGSNEELGNSLVGADLDGDGLGDLVACAQYAGWTNGYAGPGHARLYLGSTLSSSLFGASLDEGDADAIFVGEVASSANREGDRFCSSLGFPGDVDGDGRLDLLIAAPGWHNSPTEAGRGKAYLLPNPLPQLQPSPP